MKQNYDVTIVGAGPAGATLAYELASKGIEVLLLEKEMLPRYKCCAGGLSFKTAGLLKADFREAVEAEISSASVRYGNKNPYHGSYSQTILYTVMRDRFDYMLAMQARKAGATLLQGHEVDSVNISLKKAEVGTPAGYFHSKFVVGADGANSIVARSLDLKSKNQLVAAMEAEIIVPDAEMERWRSQVTLDIGCIRGGYGWVFPKLDHLSVGLACHSSKAKSLKGCYQDFLRSLNLEHYSVSMLTGSLIPVCTGKATVSQGRAALLGDAAGLVDPLTGEGIYNAILSARLAAPVIEEALLSNETELIDYQRAVEKEIYPEMKVANFLSKVFVRLPLIVFEALNRDDRAWRISCYLLRGETSYTTIKQKLGLLGGIYAFLSIK